MKQVCPKCFNTLEENHKCGGYEKLEPEPVAKSTPKQTVITKQVRKRYTHDGLELHKKKVTIDFDIDYVNEFDESWLMEFINVRLEIPEGPEDYPTIEDFYIREAKIRG